MQMPVVRRRGSSHFSLVATDLLRSQRQVVFVLSRASNRTVTLGALSVVRAVLPVDLLDLVMEFRHASLEDSMVNEYLPCQIVSPGEGV